VVELRQIRDRLQAEKDEKGPGDSEKGGE
jgi:hypothetical protein